MKFVFLAAVFCFTLVFSATAQTVAPDSAVKIEEVALARDDGSGKAGEKTDKFRTTDAPIHFFIQLDSIKPTTVKLILVAVKAEGLKPETKSVSVSYTTNGNQNQVNFNASPEIVWAAGSYRADLFLDGKSAGSVAFEIEKPAQIAEQIKTPAPKSFAPRKPVKKPRKN